MSARELTTEHLDLWTGAVTHKSSAGRGRNGKIELTGIKKLRELILELAVRGKLVEQDPNDEPASVLLERIAEEKARLVKEGKIKKPKKLPEITEEEKPFDLPEGWALARFQDTANEISTGPFGSMIHKHDYVDDGVPLINPSHMINGHIQEDRSVSIPAPKAEELSSYKLDAGDMVMARRGEVGRCAVVTNREAGWLCGTGSFALRFHSSIIRRFILIMFATDSVRRYLTGNSVGTTMTNLNHSILNRMPVALPPTITQQRIVEKVDELMALCDRLEQQVGDQLEAHEVLVDTLLDALTRSADAAEVADNWARISEHFDTLFTTESSIDKLKQAILQLAVMGRLVEQDPNDEPASVLLEKIAEEKARLVEAGMARKQKHLPKISDDEHPFEVPAGWVISRMDDITDIQSGIAKGKKISGRTTTWLPYLRVANVQRGRLDLSEVKEIEIACDEAERYSVRKRDLLITEGGDWDKVGRTAIWNAEIDPMAHQNHVFRARLVLDEQNEHWIEKYLNSGFARGYFADSSKQTTNLASINKTQLRSCTVPIPPLEEQQRIIEKVDELMALCDQLKTRLGKVSETRCQLAESLVQEATS